MEYTVDTATNIITLTCTADEIANMEAGLYAVFATPTPDGLANQLYLGARPHFKHDFLLANAGDFLEAEGWETIGWDEMSDEEQDAAEQEHLTITLSRMRRISDA